MTTLQICIRHTHAFRLAENSRRARSLLQHMRGAGPRLAGRRNGSASASPAGAGARVPGLGCPLTTGVHAGRLRHPRWMCVCVSMYMPGCCLVEDAKHLAHNANALPRPSRFLARAGDSLHNELFDI
jgi:hypothetical protein